MRLRFDPWVGKIPWRKAWQPTPVFLPAESHGQRSQVGYNPFWWTESWVGPVQTWAGALVTLGQWDPKWAVWPDCGTLGATSHALSGWEHCCGTPGSTVHSPAPLWGPDLCPAIINSLPCPNSWNLSPLFSFNKLVWRWCKNSHAVQRAVVYPLCLRAQSCPSLCNPLGAADQAPLSIGFFRQEYWNRLPFPSPGDLPDPGIKPTSLALQADSLSPSHRGRLPYTLHLVSFLLTSYTTWWYAYQNPAINIHTVCIPNFRCIQTPMSLSLFHAVFNFTECPVPG